MNSDKLRELQIDRGQKQRPQGTIWLIIILVLLLAGGAAYLAFIAKDPRQKGDKSAANAPTTTPSTPDSATATGSVSKSASPGKVSGSLLTVSGYIVARERIEISPRYMGVVKWIGVKKGDSVTNGQVVVLLDDAEYKARLHEVEGRLANAQVAVEKAQLDHDRMSILARDRVESRQLADDARLRLASAKATVKEIEGGYELAKTYLDWTVIRSPIDGVVLEKLVDPNELVVPQSFGGGRGPSTALIALADLKDLQVEIDLNEADVSKVRLEQKCKVSPEAYPDKVYEGFVAEMAPEAARQKGTLQIKVQIRNPDKFLTPELSAKVDFLKDAP
jgi:HlyD family secretion protein